MKKREMVTIFDFETAFKALSELDIPEVDNKQNRLTEKFTRSNVTNKLIEEYYDVNDSNDLEQAQADRKEEIAQAKLARIERIVDINAESPEDILPSYVGKNIIQCPQCMTLFYKDAADIEKSEEDETLCNVSEVCQHCGNDSGYTLIGKVEAVEAEEEPVENEEDSLNVEPVEEVEEENTEEPELEVIPDEELENTEEESEESDLEEIPVEESLKLYEAKLTEDEEPQEETSEEKENTNEQEAEKMLQDLKDANSYTEFVKILAKDVKSQAFINYLNQHYKNGDDTIKTIKQSNANEGKCKCSQLVPTQQNISLEKSLGVIRKPGWSEEIINTPLEAFTDPTIVYAGKYIIDGHHRWSKAYALNGGDSEIKVLNFPEIAGVSWKDMLKATQLAIVSKNPSASLINEVGKDNMLKSSKEEIKNFVIKEVCDEVVNALKAKGRGEDKESVADKICDNVAQMQNTSKPAEGAAPRSVMPQTDNAPGSVDKLKNAVIDLTEDVNKELDSKLKEHNEYIEYLKDEIEKSEKELANAKNEFVKKSIEARIDALKADLEAALPEALKNEVENELPAANEVEEVEEVKESLTRNLREEVFQNKVLIKNEFYLGDPQDVFSGYYDSEDRWNGWANPGFEKDEADRLAEIMNAGNNKEILKYDANLDAFLEYDEEFEDERPAQYVGKDCDTEDGIKHLYFIGAYGWIWCEKEELIEENLNEEPAEELLQDFANSLGEDLEAEEKLAKFEQSLEEKIIKEEKFDDVSSEEFKSMLNNPVYYEEFEEEFEELDECSLNEHISNYLTSTYKNVKSFETTSCAFDNNKLIVEGKINLKSGKIRPTLFEFTIKNRELIGKNSSLNESASYTLNYKLKNKTIITESFKRNK